MFSFETGAIGLADVNLWVGQGGGGYSYWWTNGPLRSDGIGQFLAVDVPQSRVSILAFKDGFVQPCAVTPEVRGDLAVRVEMIPISALQSALPPRPQLSVEPAVGGVIYTRTASGRQPVPGVALWAEKDMDVGLATTQSDLSGAFFLCNLPKGVYLHVRKEGFADAWHGPFDPLDPRPIEIELKRP